MRVPAGSQVTAVAVILLQRTDVNVKHGRFTVPQLKGSLGGVYPMQPDPIKLLRSYVNSREENLAYLCMSHGGLPLDHTTLWHWVKKYAEAARVNPEKVKFHSLKQPIARHLRDAGADLAFVKAGLGHASIQNHNTTIYANAKLTNTARDTQARLLFASHRVG